MMRGEGGSGGKGIGIPRAAHVSPGPLFGRYEGDNLYAQRQAHIGETSTPGVILECSHPFRSQGYREAGPR